MPKKYLLEKAATLKRFEYSPLNKESKAQTDIAKKQYQKWEDTPKFNKMIIRKVEKYTKSNLIYNNKHIFYKSYSHSKNFDNLSLKSKYSFLVEFFKAKNAK